MSSSKKYVPTSLATFPVALFLLHVRLTLDPSTFLPQWTSWLPAGNRNIDIHADRPDHEGRWMPGPPLWLHPLLTRGASLRWSRTPVSHLAVRWSCRNQSPSLKRTASTTPSAQAQDERWTPLSTRCDWRTKGGIVEAGLLQSAVKQNISPFTGGYKSYQNYQYWPG